MKFLLYLTIALIGFISFNSCQKELSAETTIAIGSLAKNAIGNCAPITTNGTYKKDTILNVANFVDVQLNITQIGTYNVGTDTINGYYFRAIGVTSLLGINTIRLVGFGKPIAVSVDVFTVKFGGTSCNFDVNVIQGTSTGGTTSAIFTFANSGAACAGATQTNNFFVGVQTNPLVNKITLLVNVTQAGSYTLTTLPSNGLTFSGTGSLSVGNNQPLILGASGTFTGVAGSIPYTFSSSTPTSTCGFDLLVQSASGLATYSINCATAVTQTGAFVAGSVLNSSSKVTLSVTPTTTGAYLITTNTANGVSFISSGNFTTTSTQNIDLFASSTNNTPVAAGSFIYVTTGGTSSCNVSVNYTGGGGAGSAVFFYTCSYSIISGTFQSGVPLTNSDKISIPVSVGVSGNYTITSNTLNGVTFSGSGFLNAASGIQYIDLTATGQTPTNAIAQSITYDLTGDLSFSCSITVPFTSSGITTDYLRAKINGSGLRNFNTNLSATISGSAGAYLLKIRGEFSSFSKPYLNFDLNSNTPVIVNTYNQTSTSSSIITEYKDFNDNRFFGSSGSGQPGPFTIQITSITTAPNRIKGTFFGTLQGAIASWGFVNVTEGEFSIPY